MNANDSGRRKLLFDSIEVAIAEQDRWVQSDTPYLTAALDEAMTVLIESFGEGAIPGDCRDLQALVSTLAEQWRAWQAEVDRRGSAMIPPPEEAWKAYEAVVECYRDVADPPRRPIESVKTLREQRVPDWQICEIYGWVDGRGQPESWKVEEELAKPGTHTEGWVDPITRDRMAAAAKEQTLRQRVTQLRQRKIERMTAECPESLEDLAHQGVPLGQMAEMLRLTEAEVVQQCEEKGIEPPRPAASMQAMPGMHEPELEEPMARQLDAREAERERLAAESTETTEGQELLSLEQKIVQLHKDGFQGSDIAADLSEEGEPVSRQKVQAVVRRFTNDPDSVVVPGGGGKEGGEGA